MRSPQSLLITALCLAALAALTRCNNGDDIAGSATETGNVTGVVTASATNQPISGTQLKVFRKKSAIASPQQDFMPLDETITDAQGRFSFTLASGTYTILAASDSQYSFVDDIQPGTEQAKNLQLQLKNGGTIKGTIENTLELRGGTAQVVVHLIGTDFYTNVHPSGTFELTEVPAGKYRLVSYTTYLKEFAPDYKSVTVKPDSVSDVGRYQLPYSGIPIPRNVSIRYDVARSANIISWSPVVGYEDFQEYTILRAEIHGYLYTLAPLAHTPDTLLVDSLDFSSRDTIQYGYSVKVRNKFGEEGAYYGTYSIKVINPASLIPLVSSVSLVYDSLLGITTLSWEPLDGGKMFQGFGGYQITRTLYPATINTQPARRALASNPAYVLDSLGVETHELGIVRTVTITDTLAGALQTLPPDSTLGVYYQVAIYHSGWGRSGKSVETSPLFIRKP